MNPTYNPRLSDRNQSRRNRGGPVGQGPSTFLGVKMPFLKIVKHMTEKFKKKNKLVANTLYKEIKVFDLFLRVFTKAQILQ